MAKYLLLLLLFFLSSVEGSTENHLRHNKNVARMFVFGDSYADTGNIARPLANSWKVPYGHTFPGQPSGRFSDGRILTDYLAKFLGFTAPIPSSRWKSAPHKARHGLNFACGGTGALNTTATLKMGLPSISSQIDSFQSTLHGNGGGLNDSIAFVSCVGNDYSTYLSTGGSMQELPRFITKVVNQLALDLRRIKSLGVAKILVTGLQPLGCMPQTTAGNNYTDCITVDNVAVELHNGLLKEAVEKLNKEGQNPSSSIFILDLYSTFYAVFREKHGPSERLRFENALKPCCIPNRLEGSCSDVDNDGKKMYTLCENPEAAFFWDSYHPTEAGWRAVFSLLKPTLKKIL